MAYEHEICAKKILISIKQHEKERGKTIRRALLTKEDIKHCANREQLKSAYIEDLIAALHELEWLLYYDGETFYLIDSKVFNETKDSISTDKTSNLTNEQTEQVYEDLFGD